MRTAIIGNANSGNGRALNAAETALGVLTNAGWDAIVKPTHQTDEATHCVNDLLKRDYDLLLACGGDGTLSALVNCTRNCNAIIGVIPGGTGNDFCRTIGLHMNPAIAARQLLAGHTQHIDLLQVNKGQASAINVMGTGLDARVADRLNKSTLPLTGRTAYTLALATELIQNRPTEASIYIDQHHWQGRVSLVAVANAVSYGAGMKISPKSRIDDGLLDVVAVEYMSRTRFVLNFPKVLKGTHLSHPAVHHWQGKNARIHTANPCPVLADGDVRFSTPIEIELLPAELKFWMPGTPA